MVKLNYRIQISNKRDMFSSHLKLWIFLGLSVLWLLSAPVNSQETDEYKYSEERKSAPTEKTTIATEVLDKVTQTPREHKNTVQSGFSKEGFYIITIVALLALIVLLSVGWYLHCRYMLVVENYKIGRPSDIDIEKGPDTEPPKVPPAEITQKQDPPESSKIISDSKKKKKRRKKKKEQNNKDASANTEQK